ncbi:MAG: hypothetical protein EPN82_11890 [Bacteroidetes bacterium]|nr:MAG: hypothetical protein EPN82_11890 [Bacteroidota bacterium]
MDKISVKAYSLGKEPKDNEYWLAQPAIKRIEAVEILRQQVISEDESKQGFQRVCRIVELSQS